MATVERITVTLPGDLLKDIDRFEKNRSRFVAEAVRRELDRRRHEELLRSLRNPHPETAEFMDNSLEDWSRTLPSEDIGTLLDGAAGKAVRWAPDQGWIEEAR